jgi:flavorubredoxin
MKRRRICGAVSWMGAQDWNRRLFEALTPTPDGTSYNAYLVQGSEKTALLDAADPKFEGDLMSQLEDIERVDYVVCHHAEQDHSGAIPTVLKKYEQAVVLCTKRAKPMLVDHVGVDPERIRVVEDDETVSLGDKSLRFLHLPWVHWPETMATYLPEERILFSCDFFGAHLASSELFAGDDSYAMDAARRYYAEIMMPFQRDIRKHLARLGALEIGMIAPSHGQVWDKPNVVMQAYADWVSDRVSNLVVLPYVSMHGSTEAMVNHLISALAQRDVRVQPFELTTTDLGKFASALVDAQTLVIGTPAFNIGPHPSAFSAANFATVLKPKLKNAAVIGSFGWGSKAADRIAELLAPLKLEMLEPVMCKGYPRPETFAALDSLADAIRDKHASTSAAV